MNRSAIDLWVGIFVVIGIGAIAFLSLKVGNLTSVSSAPGYHLDAAFDNIGGLKLRAPVKAAGVVVGRVEKIKLDPQSYQAVVAMRIDQGDQL
jgi:phospholipid/cholesterol/gamma-HCH transport system substrate-binding protein